MKIYVIRHPCTLFNMQGILQGWADSPLVAQGIETAEKAGVYFKKKNIKIIFSSDLKRCVQTGEIINKYINAKFILSSELREQNLGIYNGIHKDIFKKQFDEYDYLSIPKNGESFNNMKKRVIMFVKNQLPLYHTQVCLLITHYGCFQSILSDSLKVDLNSFQCQTNTSTIALFELKLNNIEMIEKMDL